MKTSKKIAGHQRKQQQKQAKRNRICKAREKARNREKQLRKNLIFRLYKSILHHFPNLFEKLRELADCREKANYEIAELIMACLAMFLFKEGSRNAFNNERQEEQFKHNYEKIFKLRLPHMDTVDKVLRELEEDQLEKLKTELVRGLIEKKVFYKHRFLGQYYQVVIDGSHIMNVEEGHCPHCLHRTSKNGKVTYFHNVLEAKLVCKNGFCISLLSEWIENPGGEYEKQDCEQKAFQRLAKKLKSAYPRLPICIIADGLYPNRSFFEICKENQWNWIVTFKDGNLPSVWKEILESQDTPDSNTRENSVFKNGKEIHHTYRWVNNINYHGFRLNWFECIESVNNSRKRFVYISNKIVDYDNVLEMTQSGRIRWKIENEGFNIQKHHGYGLGHKYSRVSMRAMKNYYQCMQIAHMINQLFELGSLFKPLLQIPKMTLQHLWKVMLGQLRHQDLDIQILKTSLECRIRIRYG